METVLKETFFGQQMIEIVMVASSRSGGSVPADRVPWDPVGCDSDSDISSGSDFASGNSSPRSSDIYSTPPSVSPAEGRIASGSGSSSSRRSSGGFDASLTAWMLQLQHAMERHSSQLSCDSLLDIVQHCMHVRRAWVVA